MLKVRAIYTLKPLCTYDEGIEYSEGNLYSSQRAFNTLRAIYTLSTQMRAFCPGY